MKARGIASGELHSNQNKPVLLFGGESLKVWIIETVNDAINLTVAGSIIAFFN